LIDIDEGSDIYECGVSLLNISEMNERRRRTVQMRNDSENY